MADDSPRPTDTGSKRKSERIESDAEDARKEIGLLGLGLQLALTVALFTAIGWWADKHWGWAPWGQQGLGFLGIVVGLYFFVKEAIK